MKRNAQRYSGAERAKHRYYIRLYGVIFSKAFDDIAQVAAQRFNSMNEAFQAVGKAATDSAKNVVSAIIGEYIKEKVIRPILADLDVSQ